MENHIEVLLNRLNIIENLIRSAAVPNDFVFSSQTTDYLSITQASEYLSLSKSYLYKMTSARVIPFYKVSKKVYFKRIELYDWIDKHKIKTQEEIEQEATAYILKSKKYRK